MEILFNILMGLWVLSIIIELAVFYSMFHKRHEGETVYYTGSYLNMKSDIAKKDFLDAMAITVPLNIVVFFVIRFVLGYLLPVLLFLAKWGLIIGGVSALAFVAYKHFSNNDKATETESNSTPANPPSADADEVTKHSDADIEKETSESEESESATVVKDAREELLDNAEEKPQEANPDEKIVEGKGDTNEAE